ncbi:MAG TPA: RIP metalloprotease RseP [Candidatus Omnitrophota bacterium]|nr:RIP metalloprotease RseP [Candidatus Omnitrophota bacterium]
MSTLIFLAVLSILIIVHEWGHFYAARCLGVEVERFSIGFGPKLFSWHSKGTEFMVSAIPLGGYVKMAGDERNQCKGKKNEFFSHRPLHRALIVAMGPIINFVFAYVCFYMLCVAGLPVLGTVIGKTMEGFPAEAAGLRAGDQVLSINGTLIKSWEELQDIVSGSQSQQLVFEITRENKQQSVTVAARQETLKNIFGQEERRLIVGIEPGEEISFLRYGPIEALAKAADKLWEVISMTLSALFHVVTGAMPAKDALAGPIRIFDVIADAAAMGLSYLVLVMAIISASLALFNLFPIPVLDGGHLFLIGMEVLRGKPLPLKIEERFNQVGFTLLMCLMVFVVYNDVAAMGWIDQVKSFFKGLNS